VQELLHWPPEMEQEVLKQQVFKISVVDPDLQWECGTGSRRAK
jgi:hypothetical protein